MLGRHQKAEKRAKGLSNFTPKKQVNLRKADGSICSTPEENASTFLSHFQQLYQRAPTCDDSVIDLLPDSVCHVNADLPPTDAEIKAAIQKLNNTAPGVSGILSTLWKSLATNDDSFELIRLVVLEFYETETPPMEWNIGLLAILPKKGDLKDTNNYRGIMLLETCYKIVANILHARLLPIAEQIDNETQCGFRPERSCADAIFTVKLAMKKRKEHNMETWILFLDFVKAFDRVPRHLLWHVLKKFGVPPKLIRLLTSLHDSVHVNFETSGITKSFRNSIGVKQGDTLGPLLFTFYIAAIFNSWRETTTTSPCIFKTSQDFQLTGRNHKNQGELFLIRDSEYADDAAAIFCNRSDLSDAAKELISHCR